MWIAWWPFARLGAPPHSNPGAPIDAAQLLSLARHPSTSRTRLDASVSGLRWRMLLESWELSARALEEARTDPARLALTELRAALLDEMETRHASAFARWYGGQLTVR